MDQVAALLKQFPRPLTLRASRWKWFFCLAIAGFFTAKGIIDNFYMLWPVFVLSGAGIMVLLNREFPNPPPLRKQWLGGLAMAALPIAAMIVDSEIVWVWSAAAYFAAFAAAVIRVVLLGRLELTLDADGFTLRMGRRCKRWRWMGVGEFAITKGLGGMTGRKRVGFNRQSPNRIENSHGTNAGERTGMPECDFFLLDAYGGSSGYGLPLEELVRLMSLWQNRALQSKNGKQPQTRTATRPAYFIPGQHPSCQER
jgi:hypothetical protein